MARHISRRIVVYRDHLRWRKCLDYKLLADTGTKIRVSDGSTSGFFQIFPVDVCPDTITFDGNHIWMANFAGGVLTKLTASDGHALETYPGPFGPEGIVFDGASIWVATPDNETISRY